MHEAAGKGQVSRVLEMIQMGASADDKDDKGRTGLMAAAEKGHTSVVVLLLVAGAQINEKDDQGQTALMLAAENGHRGVVKILTGTAPEQALMQVLRGQLAAARPTAQGKDGALKLPGIEVKIPTGELVTASSVELDARDKEGRTAYLRAVVKEQHDSAYWLGFWKSANTKVADHKGNTALHLLAARPDAEIWRSTRLSVGIPEVRAFYKDSTSYVVGSNASRDAEGNEPWMVAAAAGHLDVVKKLLPEMSTARLRLESRNTKGKTGLELAREAKHQPIVEYLTSLGSVVAETPKVEKRPALNAALAKAVKAGDESEVERLLKASTPADGVDDKGQTALMLAVAADADRICLLLLQNVTNKDPSYLLYHDSEGKSALRLAAGKGKPTTLDAVLTGLSGMFERGQANWFAALIEKGKDGKSVLDLVKDRADKPTEESMEKYIKGQLNRRNSRTMTALEDACERGQSDAVRGLLARGASRSRPGQTKTALIYAAENGHILAVQALLESFKDAIDRLKYIDERPFLTDRQNYVSALELAREKKHSEIVALIEKYREMK